ncbi:MAG: hypothetical protein FWC08_01725 [Defluviitaleaceae bacterium]|nr:hypothetical protein [Defluviitaleaceae bacterium]
MPDVIINGLFSLLGALLGAGTSIFILSRTMKKNLQLEINKIKMQKEAALSIRLLDKKEAYLAELLVALSTVRNAAIDCQKERSQKPHLRRKLSLRMKPQLILYQRTKPQTCATQPNI